MLLPFIFEVTVLQQMNPSWTLRLWIFNSFPLDLPPRNFTPRNYNPLLPCLCFSLSFRNWLLSLFFSLCLQNLKWTFWFIFNLIIFVAVLIFPQMNYEFLLHLSESINHNNNIQDLLIWCQPLIWSKISLKSLVSQYIY